MPRASDIGNSLKELLRLVSDVHSVAAIASSVKGHEPSDDAPAAAKGAAGIFGGKDEREWQLLLKQLENSERAIVDDFLDWHFHRDLPDMSGLPKRVMKTYAWLQKNRYRTFITQMGSTPGSSEGTEVTTVKTRDRNANSETTTKTTKNLHTSGTNNGLDHLKRMVRTITSHGENREEGYRAYLHDLKMGDIPHIPEKPTIEHMLRVFERAEKAFENTADFLEQKNTEQKNSEPNNFLFRLIKG